jgi:RNA polymerase sigma factor (sigma-70 family)
MSPHSVTVAIRNKDYKILEKLYKSSYPAIQDLVMNYYGSPDDAKDLFQEAFLVVYDRIKKEDFQLECSFQTFIYSVCKNLWFKELRRRKSISMEPYFIDRTNENMNEEMYSQFRKNMESRLYYKHFKNLSEECRKVIRLYMKKLKTEQIAQMMGYDDKATVRRKKFDCKLTLIRNIRKDPDFNKIVDYEYEYEHEFELG